jgi:hypothetical protein
LIKRATLAIILIFIILIPELSYFYFTKNYKLSKAEGELKVLEIRNEVKEGQVSLKIEVSLTYCLSFESHVRLLVFPLPVELKTFSNVVYIYFDERYPSFGLGLREWIGLKDHIPIELKKLGFEGKIVNAIELGEILLKEGNACIIIPSGVLPDTVYSVRGGLISNWLENGGVLIWIGYKIGYYIGHEDGELTVVGDLGQKLLLGYELNAGSFSYWEAIANEWTAFAKGLALSYPHAWMGPNLDAISEHDGIAIGGLYTSNNDLEYSSISILPHAFGKGKVILFGGGVGYAGAPLGEDFVARDIAKILWSGLQLPDASFYSYFSPFLPINYSTQWVKGSSEIKFWISIDMPLGEWLSRGFYLTILVFSMSFYTELYIKKQALCVIKGTLNWEEHQ